MDLKILYEDNHIIAVYKPAGVLVQLDKPGGHSLTDDVKKYLKEEYKKSGNVFLGLVHRLDRNVSGIVLFGKTSKGASRLSEQFRDNEIVKIYNAVVEGVIKPNSGTLIHYLNKDEGRRVALVSDTPKQGYDRAELAYETVRSELGPYHDRDINIISGLNITSGSCSLIKIELKTGRFHQIRAQFSAIGHPVVGDKKYGAKSRLLDGSIALCAVEIEFKTATTDEVEKLKIDYPSDWNKLLVD